MKAFIPKESEVGEALFQEQERLLKKHWRKKNDRIHL